ncbi:MAG: aldo/keto reductase [Planctomycetes bacterium]|nr:aldo/keto reductase [Planctomycetota bacterium]
MKRVKLGGPDGLEVSQCGMGVMSITAFYGDPIPDEIAIELIQQAVESECTFFDTAEAYVAEHPVTKKLLWNEEILGKAVATIGRDKVEIGTKFGGRSAITGPAKGDHMKNACHAALKRLQTDTIDLYYLHRVDPNVPIEETVSTMAELVHTGGTFQTVDVTDPLMALVSAILALYGLERVQRHIDGRFFTAPFDGTATVPRAMAWSSIAKER